MKRISTILFVCVMIQTVLVGQEIVQISTGSSYAEQAYYSLADNATTNLDNDSWDLAFATGSFDVGIHYNESVTSSMSGTAPALRLYLAPTQEFTDVIDPATLTDSLYNAEESWSEGAFNSEYDPADPFDFGWGSYNPGNHQILGTRVFVLKLRDESFKKIKIESLIGDILAIKYADLDGANESVLAINKAQYTDSPLALFSFDTGMVTASPAAWDLLFARYQAPLDAGGFILQYNVTGILSAPGVQVAAAKDIDPAFVDHLQYVDSLDDKINGIGHDWKYFDLDNFSWEVRTDEAYFVKQTDNHLWKIVFLDFEGSSTGTATFEKTSLGMITSVENPRSNFTDFGVFPNPIGHEFTLSFSLRERKDDLHVQLINNTGQTVGKWVTQGDAGLNVLTLDSPQVPSGLYRMMVGSGADLITESVWIK